MTQSLAVRRDASYNKSRIVTQHLHDHVQVVSPFLLSLGPPLTPL